MKQKIVMFDFDNTLVDSLKYWYDIQNKKMFILYGLKVDKLYPKKRRGLTNLENAKLFIRETGIDKTPQEIKEEWHEQMKVCYTQKIKMIKGAKEFLLKLKSEKKKLVLASATDLSLLKIALKHFEILDLFDEIFTEQNVRRGKRDKEFFEIVLNKLEAKPKDVFFFEDSVESLKNAIETKIPCCGLIHKFNKDRIKELDILKIKNYKNIEKKLKTLNK